MAEKHVHIPIPANLGAAVPRASSNAMYRPSSASACHMSISGASLARATSEAQLHRPGTALARLSWSVEQRVQHAYGRVPVPAELATSQSSPAMNLSAAMNSPADPPIDEQAIPSQGKRPPNISLPVHTPASSTPPQVLAPHVKRHALPLFTDEMKKKADLWARGLSESPRSAADKQWRLSQEQEVLRLMSRTAHRLKAENDALQDQMAAEASMAQTRIDELMVKLAAERDEHQTLHQGCMGELLSTRETLADVQGSLATAEADIELQRAEKDEWQRTANRLKAEMTTLQAELNDCKLSRIPALIADHKEQFGSERDGKLRAQAQAERAYLETQLLSGEVEHCERLAGQQQLQSDRVNAALLSCQGMLARSEAEMQLLAIEIELEEAASLLSEQERRKDKSRALSQRAAMMTRSVTQQLGDNRTESALRSTIAELEQTIAEHQHQHQALEDRIQDLEQQLREHGLTRNLSMLALRTYRREVKLRDEKLQDAEKLHQQSLEETERKESEHAKEMKKATFKHNRQQERIEQLETQEREKRDEHEALLKEVAELRRDNEKLKGKFALLQTY